MTDEELLRDGTLLSSPGENISSLIAFPAHRGSRIFAEAEAEAAVRLQVAILAVLAGVTSSCH